jgi:hypothetical protein
MEQPIKKTRVQIVKEHGLFGLKTVVWVSLIDLATKLVPLIFALLKP